MSDRTPVMLLGNGGHAAVALQIVTARADLFVVVGATAPPGSEGALPPTVPLLGSDEEGLEQCRREGWSALVAVGDNWRRSELYERCRTKDVPLVTAVHPSAIVAADAPIGAGALVAPGAMINTCAAVGSNVIVNSGACVEHHCRVGDHAHVAPRAVLGGRVEVGEGTLIGIGATVLPGVRIGRWATVGGGAVVTRDLPDGSTAVGVPARLRAT